MTRKIAVVLHWKGRELGPRDLPAGDYVIAKYKPRELSPAEDEGLRKAIDSIDRGEGIPWQQARAGIADRLARKRKRRTKSR